MKTFLPFIWVNFRHALKNPLLWIALLVCTAIIFAMFADILTGPFPMVEEAVYTEWAKQLEEQSTPPRIRSLMMEYMIRSSDWDTYVSRIRDYCRFCEVNFQIPGEAAFHHILENRLSWTDDNWDAVSAYLYSLAEQTVPSERLAYFVPLQAENARNFGGSLHLGSYEEAMAQVQSYLALSRYSEYMGRRIGDIGGLVLLFACFVLFSMTFSRESAPEMFELLHVKRISPAVFVWGKYLGSSLAVLLMGFLSMTILTGITAYHCIRQGMDWGILDLYKYYFAWVVPSMLMVGAIMTAFTMLCRTGIPLIPLLFFWVFAGTQSVTDGKGTTIAKQFFWNITVRISSFHDALFVPLEQSFYLSILPHKLFQAAVTLLCMTAAVLLYERQKIK